MRLLSSGVTVSLMTGTGSGGDAQGDRLLNIENLVGSNFDDTLEGGTVSGSLDGGLGNDTVSFAHAASGAAGAGVTVNLALTSWQNTITGGWRQLLNFENVTGSAFNDTLVGSFGNDIITGLGGNDTLTGAGGNDTFVFLPGFRQRYHYRLHCWPEFWPARPDRHGQHHFCGLRCCDDRKHTGGSETVITVDAQNTNTLPT